jgi:hypothetical protein
MTITLRASKSTALTFIEMDGNFTDLDTRVDTIEGAYVSSINGINASSNALTLTSANVTENTNLYYTDARVRSAISVTDSGGDGSLAFNSSTGVITYTGPTATEVRAHFSEGEGINISAGAISAEDATDTNKGIASFSADHFTVTSGAVVIKADGIDNTHIDFGAGSGQVDTDDIPEGSTNKYTTATNLNSISVDALSDVDITTSAPSANQVLTWDAGNNKFVPATPPGATGGEANTVSKVGTGSDIFSAKVGVDIRLRSIIGSGGVVVTQNTNDITLTLGGTPTFTGVKVANDGNIGSAGDPDAIAISATGVVTMDQIPVFSAGINVSGGTIAGTLATAAQTSITSIGTLSALQVDNININGNTISSTAGTDLNITPLGGQQVVIDGAIIIDAGVVTGITSITAGTAIIDHITISDNNIAANASNANLVLLANGTGLVEVDSNIDMNSNKIINVTDPASAQDASTKAYVDAQISAISSTAITEGNSNVTVTDSGTGSVVTTVDGVAEITTISAKTTFGGNLVIPDGATIGTVTDADSITIAAAGDVTVSQGLIVTGNLTVNGTTTTLNTAEMKIEDINLTIADGASDSAAANGAGITIDGAGATITYAHTGTKFVFNKPIDTGANNITTTGTVAGDHSGDGSALTTLNGSQVTTGTVAAARVATLNQDTTGTAGIATTITIVDESTDTTCFPTFVTAATGNLGAKTDSVFTYNSANGTLGATTFSGVATSAQYADVAEKYLPDANYESGTVVCVGGPQEVTICGTDDYPAGVISTNPAYLMNKDLEGGIDVALLGRVPVRVFGEVNKGNKVYTDINGRTSRSSEGSLVGIALETNTDQGEKLVECLLKV